MDLWTTFGTNSFKQKSGSEQMLILCQGVRVMSLHLCVREVCKSCLQGNVPNVLQKLNIFTCTSNPLSHSFIHSFIQYAHPG
jgi:hypothetical protein